MIFNIAQACFGHCTHILWSNFSRTWDPTTHVSPSSVGSKVMSLFLFLITAHMYFGQFSQDLCTVILGYHHTCDPISMGSKVIWGHISFLMTLCVLITKARVFHNFYLLYFFMLMQLKTNDILTLNLDHVQGCLFFQKT